MATRSTIALEREDGVIQVYCHWDGYLENNGRILMEHYDTPAKVAELLSNGDISSLRPTVGCAHPFSCFDTGMSTQDFDALYGNMTTYYGRDRGEAASRISMRRYDNFDAYQRDAQQEEYNYIMRDGQWFVEYYATGGCLMELSEAFHNEAEMAD
jgi:hypothetical protein